MAYIFSSDWCFTFFGTKRFDTNPKTKLLNAIEKSSMNKGFLSGFTQNDQGKLYEDELE